MDSINEIEIIKECIDTQSQISLEREDIDDELLTVIPIGMSNQLLAAQYFYDFTHDGFKVLCIDDISKVRRRNIEEFHDKIFKSEGLINN